MGKVVNFRYDFEIIIELVLFKSLCISFEIECAVLVVAYTRARTVTVGMYVSSGGFRWGHIRPVPPPPLLKPLKKITLKKKKKEMLNASMS